MVWAALLTVACGSPIQPPPPPPELQITCPASIVHDPTTLEGAEVEFEVPTPSGGSPPYKVECVPGPGMFPIGDSRVECQATDAAMKQAACGFAVTVPAPQTLARTRFVAFGDSITEGQIDAPAAFATYLPFEAYPHKLEQMLRDRYPLQQITVVNSGKGGEDTDEGLVRLPGVLAAEQPEVLLLFEGTNGLTAANAPSRARDLASMVALARARGVDVIIATITPVRAPHLNSRPTKPAGIVELNRRIAHIADEFDLGAPVDLYALFQSDMTLLGADGLHPTAHGQTRIADAFNEAVLQRYAQQPESSDPE